MHLLRQGYETKVGKKQPPSNFSENLKYDKYLINLELKSDNLVEALNVPGLVTALLVIRGLSDL